jgi:NTP pyrophosphatase (non-canonical NTP hydrolase)
MIEKIIKEINELSEIENKTVPEMFIKFNEEFGEFAAEVVKMLGNSYKPYDQEHLIEEMADSLQCLLCLYIKISKEKEFDLKEVIDQVSRKNNKWREKISQYTNNNK